MGAHAVDIHPRHWQVQARFILHMPPKLALHDRAWQALVLRKAGTFLVHPDIDLVAGVASCNA